MTDTFNAIITLGASLLTLIGTIVSVTVLNRKQQAVTDYKIDELTRAVREHNNFAHRMPVVEEQIKALTAAVNDLKSYHK